jgi:hypothetical protein
MVDAEAVYHGETVSQACEIQQTTCVPAKSEEKPDMAGHEGQIAGRPHYALGMYVDGVFRFRFASGFRLQPSAAASADDKYLESQLRLFCGMSHLESQHAPALSQYRNIVSDRVPAHEGTSPGCEQMCAAVLEPQWGVCV